ncbi:hypothetical protein CG436_17385 [Pantoea ananatis]|nr:hypothetical protein CG436_17385 [Pantoea ananatis]
MSLTMTFGFGSRSIRIPMSIRVWQGGTHDGVMARIAPSLFCFCCVDKMRVCGGGWGHFFSGGLNQDGCCCSARKKAIRDSGKYFSSNQRVEIK